MAWLPPENKLDEQQREFIQNANFKKKNIWVKGFAGSGKSILLLYVAKKVLQENPNARILLVVYTHSLVKMFEWGFEQIGLDIPVSTYYSFMDSTRSYDYILCDEVQDLTPRVIQALKERSNHLVVAGDENQSIYEQDPRWREYTVNANEIERLINGDSFALSIVHRLSRTLLNAVQSLFPSRSLFESKTSMTHKDTAIKLCKGQSELEEVKYVYEKGEEAIRYGYSCAVLIPTGKLIITFVNNLLKSEGKVPWNIKYRNYNSLDWGDLNTYLASQNIPMQYIGNGYGNFKRTNKIILSTYHSAKGLDFDYVFIPFCNQNLFISPKNDMAKTLFMVAMTRSKVNLYITYTGEPNELLDSFQNQCTSFNIGESTNLNTNNVWGL